MRRKFFCPFEKFLLGDIISNFLRKLESTKVHEISPFKHPQHISQKLQEQEHKNTLFFIRFTYNSNFDGFH